MQKDDVLLERNNIQLTTENKLLQEKLAKAEKVIEDFVEYFDHSLMDFCIEYDHFEACGFDEPFGELNPSIPKVKQEEPKEIEKEVSPKEEVKESVTPPKPQPQSPPVKRRKIPTFPIYFESKKELKDFKKRLHFLTDKYDLPYLDTAAIMGVEYTTQNSQSVFLDTVKSFVKKYF